MYDVCACRCVNMCAGADIQGYVPWNVIRVNKAIMQGIRKISTVKPLCLFDLSI